jgi:uncharacterized Zn finger protein
MSYFAWRPYVPVAQRQKRAHKELAKLAKRGESPAPVKVEGRKIASSFWGKSWCENLERYSDFANRLPRGRTYVRNGSVVDLKINEGEVFARVAGSELYRIKIEVAPVKPARWKAICRDCAGTVGSLIELLQGRIAKSVMERVCSKGDGLFPAPEEIKLSCSCPDWADMCKHVAAALYGVGARLDEKPELLFVLRNVDQKELLAGAGRDLAFTQAKPSAKVIDDGDVAALFGLEMAEAPAAETPVSVASARPKRSKPPAVKQVAAAGKTKPVKKKAAKGRSVIYSPPRCQGAGLPTPLADTRRAGNLIANSTVSIKSCGFRPAFTAYVDLSQDSLHKGACSPASRKSRSLPTRPTTTALPLPGGVHGSRPTGTSRSPVGRP